MRIAHLFPDLDPATRSHVLHLYGSLAEEMLEPALLEPSLLEPIHPMRPTSSPSSRTRASRSGRSRVEDVLWRRTTLGHRGLADAGRRAGRGSSRVPRALGSA
jgi:glycerol-3-phosphate dehydrogenase